MTTDPTALYGNSRFMRIFDWLVNEAPDLIEDPHDPWRAERLTMIFFSTND